MTATAYGNLVRHAFKSDFDWDTATIKAMLTTASYTFDKDHEFRSSVTSGEASGTGYTAGGISLTGVASSYDSTNNWTAIDADDAAFGTVTLTAVTGMVLYVSVGSAATDILISYHSFASQSPSAVPFTYQFDAAGIGKFPV